MSSESEAAALYSKYPLDHERNQIRLLVLHPGDWDDQISSDFEIVSLGDQPIYTALSYVWGRDDPDKIANIGGCCMPIRPNLFTALRRLRAHAAGKDSTIWVDAVCINQTSIGERNSQVAMMGKIYSSCASVLVWFGELELAQEIWPDCPTDANPGRCYAIDHAEEPLESKEEIEEVIGSIPEWEGVARIATYLSLMAVRREKSTSARTGTLTSYSLFKNEHLERYFMKIVEALGGNEWFTRVWVIQEYVLAPVVTFYIGSVAIPSTIFSTANERFQDYLRWPYATSREELDISCRTLLFTGITKFVQFSQLRDEIRSNTKRLTVLELRLRLSQRHASVDLDQVYSLYGVVDYVQSHCDQNRVCGRELIPNYNDTPKDAYTAIALAHLEAAQSLLALSISSYKHSYANTPSWVIDWTALQSDSMSFDRHLWTEMYEQYHADQGLIQHQSVFASNSKSISLRGFLVDEIALTAQFNNASELSSFMGTIRRHDPDTLYPGDQKTTWAEAYFRTILADGVRNFTFSTANDNKLCRLTRSGYSEDIMLRLPFILHSYSPWEIDDPYAFSGSSDHISNSESYKMWGKCQWRSGNIPPAAPTAKDLANLVTFLNTQAKSILSGRNLFLTKGGYIGVAHKCSPGDKIYIVKGGSTPIILEELSEPLADTSEQRNERLNTDPGADCNLGGGKQYRVVTDCYLHGVMDGERNAKLLKERGGLGILLVV